MQNENANSKNMQNDRKCKELNIADIKLIQDEGYNALHHMQQHAKELGLDRMTLDEINAEIDACRREHDSCHS